MINPLRLDFEYTDFWSEYTSKAVAETDAILRAGCYVPRYYHAPRNGDEQIAGPGGNLKYSLLIPAGSWILGFWHLQTTAFNSSPTFLAQITDVGLNHKWYTIPQPEAFFASELNNISFLNKPYPVIAPGVFLVEFWQNNNSTNRCQLTFAVAEVNPDLIQKGKGAPQ